MSDDAPAQAGRSHDPAEGSLQDDLRQLAADARALAEAELAYQKARASFAGSELPRIAALGLATAVLAFFALMALALGSVLALTPWLGAWGATGAVAGGLLIFSAICALMALLRWKHVSALLSPDENQP